MIKIAHHIGAIDMPRSDEGNRHIHKKATPLLGGLGVFLAFMLSFMIFGDKNPKMNAILIGSFIIVLTSIIDDIKPIKSWQKLIGHIVGASVIVFYGHILLENITAFGFNQEFGIFSYPITILFIVACTNIINLIDGIDGLSCGICSIFYITVGIIGIYQGRSGSLVMILTFIMLGATLGFLLFNFHPAKIFAGDCSTFFGFIIAIISLLEFKGPALTSFFVPIAILAIPILDTLFAIIRRITSSIIRYEFFRSNYSINNIFNRCSIFYCNHIIYVKGSKSRNNHLRSTIHYNNVVCFTHEYYKR